MLRQGCIKGWCKEVSADAEGRTCARQVLGIPEERIWVSVYEEDDEAERLWLDLVGVAPEKVKRMGAADNFWASGPTGPCGPCSELYYDFHPERGTAGADLDDDSRFIEFYNLVFMESNRAPDGTLTPLVRVILTIFIFWSLG